MKKFSNVDELFSFILEAYRGFLNLNVGHRVYAKNNIEDLFGKDGIDFPNLSGVKVLTILLGIPDTNHSEINKSYVFGIYTPSPEERCIYGGPLNSGYEFVGCPPRFRLSGSYLQLLVTAESIVSSSLRTFGTGTTKIHEESGIMRLVERYSIPVSK